MTTGISDEHVELHRTTRRWAEARCPASVPRALLEAEVEGLPPFWNELVELGWTRLAVDFGLPEAAIVVEELGRACAPGPFLPTVLASVLLSEGGADDLIGPPAAVGLAPGAPVLSGGTAEVFVLPVDRGWRAFTGDEVTVEPRPSVDETRRVATVVSSDAGRALALPDGRVEQLAAVLVAAEAVGVIDWCVATASAYAGERQQFGRPIGQFQAIKHRCADMLVSLERTRALAWDAARAASDPAEGPFAAALAAAVAPDAAVRAVKSCIQVLGGIGFTWEHDAHLYLKRAMGTAALFPSPAHERAAVARRAVAGERRTLHVDLPGDDDPRRVRARAAVAQIAEVRGDERRARQADSGYLVPHWPAPWGLDADPVEQLIIDDEFRAARVRRPHLQVGAWVLPTLIAHGTPEQQERFIPPTLRGELSWCQLFSEPGAGSDLASLTTRAERAEGGWRITGQKVWTSMAKDADWGICLARTTPLSEAPKHDGITCFLVEMSAPGIDIRPLREITGASMFNEVFLDGVPVPDDCVVGPVDAGWGVSRTTLENERVSMSGGSGMGPGVESVLQSVTELGHGDDALVLDEVGGLVVEAQALALLALRTTLRSLGGAEHGPEASVRKLLGVEHDQRVPEVGLSLLGPHAAANDGAAAAWVNGLLWSRCLTIAGGTSEIQRNVIAERLLGLPKDP
ncbi:MAG TPA: acyl-CoA dehydrogenase [Acidimicrobiales bacterium]|nr:acyl-CoA dehydrogenase [Acidimicrobiales bacterium]